MRKTAKITHPDYLFLFLVPPPPSHRYALLLGEIEATASLLFHFHLCLTLHSSLMRCCKSADSGPDLIQGRSNRADQFGKSCVR